MESTIKQTLKPAPQQSVGGFYYLLRGIMWIFQKCQPTTLDKMARIMAFVCFDLLRLRRKLVLKNLGIVFGETLSLSEKIRMGRKSAYHLLMNAFELFASKGKLSDQVKIIDQQHFTDALAQGKGAYLLACHLGSWEATTAAINRQIGPTYVITKPLKSPSANRLLNELRHNNGFLMIERQKKGDAYIGLRRILGKNQMVGIAFDHARPDSPKFNFFGHPAKTNTSIAFIHHRHPAPVVPVFSMRTGPCQHQLTVLPPIELQHSNDIEADVIANTKTFQQVIEKMISQCPEQYFWYHNRWKK